jgi:hypothetical protein
VATQRGTGPSKAVPAAAGQQPGLIAQAARMSMSNDFIYSWNTVKSFVSLPQRSSCSGMSEETKICAVLSAADAAVRMQQAEATLMALLLLLVPVDTSGLVTLPKLSVNLLSGSAVFIKPGQQHGVCCV